MSTSLLVRKLDAELVSRLKRRASRNGRSAEDEHREILRQALFSELELDVAGLAARMRELTRGRKQMPSQILQREGRQER